MERGASPGGTERDGEGGDGEPKEGDRGKTGDMTDEKMVACVASVRSGEDCPDSFDFK